MAALLRACIGSGASAFALALALEIGLHVAARHRERRMRGRAGEQREHPPHVGLLAREALLSLVGLVTWVVPAARPDATTTRLAVLVHGLGGSPGSLWLLAHRLRRDGWSVAVPRLGWWRSLDAGAARLARVLERAIPDAGAPDVVVIAAGSGGLVARQVIQDAGAGVRALATLGTPHGGTAFGARLPCSFLDDVRPDADALRRLQRGRLPAGVEAIALASPEDVFIVPAAHARWPEACTISIDGVGHRAMAWSSRVYRILAENLTPPAVRRAGPHGD